jgi:hypothetical protein
VRNTKDELSRFARDIYRIVCEVIAEKFRPETIAAMTGYKYVPGQVIGVRRPPMPGQMPMPAPGMSQPRMGGPGPAGLTGAPAMMGVNPSGAAETFPPGGPPDMQDPGALPPGAGSRPGIPMPGGMGQPQMPQGAPGGPPPAMPEADPMIFDDQVMQRLRDDRVRAYSIDVETDSTIQPDEDAEKQRRIEFATMFGGFLKQAGELFQYGPMAAPLAPMIAEGLKFTVRGFRAGRQLEDAIDRAMDQLLAMIKQAASQPPKPTPEEIKMQGEIAAQKREDERSKMEMAAKAQEDQRKAGMEQQKAQLDERMSMMDMQLKEREHAMKLEQMQRQAQLDVMSFQMEIRKMQQQAALAAAQPKGPANGGAEAGA